MKNLNKFSQKSGFWKSVASTKMDLKARFSLKQHIYPSAYFTDRSWPASLHPFYTYLSGVSIILSIDQNQCMTLTEFYQLAESSISNNPQDRLSRDIKNVIAALPHDVDKMLFDTYAQCFTKEHIPDGILNFKQPKGLYTGKIAALRRKGLRHLKKWFPGSGNGKTTGIPGV